MSFTLATGETVMRRMKRVLIVCLVLGIVGPTAVAEEPYYKGLVQLEVDLYTGDGVRLQEGRYRVEVRPDRGHYTLAFLSDDQVKAVYQVKAVVNGYKPDDGKLPATALFMGTEYLRSSEEPELTMEERRHSKTGQPQYQEENREWKAEFASAEVGRQHEGLLPLSGETSERGVAAGPVQVALEARFLDAPAGLQRGSCLPCRRTVTEEADYFEEPYVHAI